MHAHTHTCTHTACRSSIIVVRLSWKQVIRVETPGVAVPHTQSTLSPFLGSEENSLKLLRLAELQHTNSTPISNCLLSKSTIVFAQYKF